MTSISTQASATIYQFPVGGRAGVLTSAMNGQTSSLGKLPTISDYVLTDAWYHQEAIRDSRLASKQ